jgi:hypothetical protein
MKKPKAVHLTIKGVKAAALQAAEEKRLQAFAPPSKQGPVCAYKKGKLRCIIGAALPDEVLDYLQENGLNESNLSRLRAMGIVTTSSAAVAKKLENLQYKHDLVIRRARMGVTRTYLRDSRQELVGILSS